MLACSLVTSRLLVREDVSTLLPMYPKELRQSFRVLQKAPFVDALTMAVGGKGTQPTVLADQLAAQLRSPLIPTVITGPGGAGGIAALEALCAAVPNLLPEEAMRDLQQRVSDLGVRTALEADKQILMSPKGIGLRGIISHDPLNLRALALNPLAALNRPEGMHIQDGHLLDKTGTYAMLIAKPALPMTDSLDATRVMDAFRKGASTLPGSAELLLVGGHRHAEANAHVIKDDIARILPLSVLLLVAAFAFFLRSWQGLCIFFVPLAALSVACAVTAMVYGSVSGIVIGFGSVLLGITSDYAVHIYFAVRSAASPEEGIRAVCSPLLIAGTTTIAAFLGMHISTIPGIQQMATLTVAGVVTALFFALVVLPLCLRSAPRLTPALSGNVDTCRPAGSKLACAWVLVMLILGASLSGLHLDGDIRHLAYKDKEIEADETRMRDIWQTSREGTIIAANAPSGTAGEDALEKALQTNDAVWHTLQYHPDAQAQHGKILSIAPLLPSKALQKQRSAAWLQFWENNADTTCVLLEREGETLGFSAGAFTPFLHTLKSVPSVLELADIRKMGFALFADLLLRQNDEDTTVFTLVADSTPLSQRLITDLQATGAVVASGVSFRQQVAEATRHDLLWLCGISLCSVVAGLGFSLRNPRDCALVLLPTGTSVASVLAVFSLMGLPVSIFHTVSLPLIIALSVDYGLFMFARLQGRLDESTQKSITLSAVTTIIGFGCLALARHPALFSLGVTVAAGMSVSLVSALYLLPRMMSQRQEGC